MLTTQELQRARTMFAEQGFEYTVEEMRHDEETVAVLEMWKSRIANMEPVFGKVKELVRQGVIWNADGLQEVLEEHFGHALDRKELWAVCSMIEIFRGKFT